MAKKVAANPWVPDMRKPGLYLDGQRFDVNALRLERSRERGREDVRITGRVVAPPGFTMDTLFSKTVAPVIVRYRGMSGPFWFDASISCAITFTAVSCGACRWR